MQFTSSSIGRKILMAITGSAMVLFALVHLLGNSSIFNGSGGLNSYAEHLHSMPLPLIVIVRLLLLSIVCVHIWFGIQLTLENSGGRPSNYAVKSTQKASFASENMIWTGVLLGLFIAYHLMQFTFRATPGMALGTDVTGRFDVFAMVVSSFQNFFVTFIYAGAMIALYLHLSHGIQSFFQTMGLCNDRLQDRIGTVGTLVALALFLGFVAIPLSIFTGILKG
jgi:succinate dehydrogenase / fumarate reductase cytochrome b subunit